MSKIFTPELLSGFLIQILFSGILLFFVQHYFENKWAPTTAAETLKKENQLNAKRDVYFQAIDLINRYLSYIDFVEPGKPLDTTNRLRGAAYPTEIEVNSCFTKLCIYSDNKQIPLSFRDIFVPPSPNFRLINEMITLVALMRTDVGKDGALTSVEDYKFIQIHRKQ
jgi:hypothetical protein